MKRTYRYPGTQSFQKEDAEVFFGREEDIRRLSRLMRLEQLVILYGKSGLGKTSLLNAGLLPRLEEEMAAEAEEETNDGSANLEVREIRFGAYQEGITDRSLGILQQQFQADFTIDPLLESLVGQPKHLWYYFKSKQLRERDKRTTLLVFDQFEELFTYPESQIEEFKQEFSALLNNNAPDDFQKAMMNRLREDRKAFSREDKRWLNAPLNIKVIIGVRSDRLSLLDQFTSLLPNMLVNLYELKPLDREQARAAITEPAKKTSDVFLTPAFAYDPSALKIMLDSLSNDQGEIESFQLQLLCQYLENHVAENPDTKLIKTENFGGVQGVQTILNDYYEREIGKLPADDQIVARRFIEEGLIANERRIAAAAGSEQDRFGVSETLTQSLLNSRLIRAENIHLGKIYELSHDTLVDPVLKSYAKRKLEEERLQAEQELAIQKEQLRKEQKRRRIARLYAIIGFTLFAAALIAGVFARRNSQIAKKQEKQAKAAALAAKAWAVYRNDHTLAFRIAESAFKVDPENEEVEQTLLKIINSSETSFYEKVLTEHQFEIEAIEFSSDGQYFATGSHDTDVRIWDRQGKPFRRFIGKRFGDQQTGHRQRISGLAFSPDNRRLVSVGWADLVKIWDIEGDSLLLEFFGHSNNTYAVDFANRDDWFVTVGGDSLAHIWTLDGQKKATLNGHESVVNTTAISADDRFILTASQNGLAILWNNDGREIRRFSNERNPILAVAFLPDNEHFVLGSSNKTAEIWNIDGNKVRSLGGHNGQVTDVAVSPDGNFILTASEDATAKVWSIQGEEMLTLTGHTKRLNAIAIAPDGKTILTGGYDFTIKMWDADFNLNVQTNRHTDFIYSVDVSEDNSKIVTSSKDNTAKLWNFSGQMLANFVGHQHFVQSAFFVPARPEVITSSLDGTIRIWALDGKEIVKMSYGEPILYARASPDRELIVAGSFSGKVLLYDQNGQLTKQWQAGPPKYLVTSVDFSPDYDKILSGQGNAVRIWNLGGELLDSLVNPNVNFIYRAIFSADGQSIYTGAQEYPVKEWALNGALSQSYYGHSGEVYALANHPTQAYIASGGWDQTVKIWDRQGNIVQNYIHPNGVYAVAFSKDGQYLVTGSHDNIGRIWDMDGKLINALGDRVNITQTAQAPEVASLSGIPFRMSELDIPLEYVAALFGDGPNRYLAEGEEYLAMTDHSKLEESRQLYDQALEAFKKGAQLSEQDSSISWNAILASAFKEKGEFLLTKKQFQEAEACFDEGLNYQELEYFIILKTLTYLFNGQFNEAQTLALEYKDRPTPQTGYANYADAFLQELWFFENQFGLAHPDTERFKQLFGEEE